MKLLRCVKKIGVLLLLLFFAFTCFFMRFTTSVKGAQTAYAPTTLRVALGLNLNSMEFAVSEGSYELIDYLTQRVVSPASINSAWIVAPAGNASLQINNNGVSVGGLGSSRLLLRQKDNTGHNVFRFNGKQYRGDLLIENLRGKLQIINIIDVEQYLYGVVGSEIGSGAPEEALKTQAVVSRTFALFFKEHPQLNYDVGISTSWQVYGGYDAEISAGQQVKKAIQDTAGQVIYYDNNIIRAFFHSNSGGYSEACENVWVASLPYIQPVATPEDALPLKLPQQGSWPAETYAWEKSFTRQELVNRLGKWNRGHSNNGVNVGVIKDISVQRWAVDSKTKENMAVETASGRVTRLDIMGSRGTKSFYRDRIRSVLGLRSTLFEIISDSTVRIWNAFGTSDTCNNTSYINAVNADGFVTKLNGNRSSYYVMGADGLKTVPKDFTNITIKGKGYGHGLGMSQWGAWGMAQNGVDYARIIEHFYNQDKFDGRLKIGVYRAGS